MIEAVNSRFVIIMDFVYDGSLRCFSLLAAVNILGGK